jgi:hypothetical protein
MPFREKTAWVMMTLLTLTGAFYAWEVAGHAMSIGWAPPPSIKLIFVYVGLVIIGSIVGMTSIAVVTPKEANAPADERDRIISDKAGNWAGYVLALPALAGALVFWVIQDGNILFHAVIAGLMLSQIAEYAFQIWLYRRGV